MRMRSGRRDVRLAIAEQTGALVREVAKGVSVRDAARRLGIPPSTAQRRVDVMLASLPPVADIEERRREELDRLDQLLEVWMPKAAAGDDGAADLVARILEMRARIGGYDPDGPPR